jgi:hypothetical protein
MITAGRARLNRGLNLLEDPPMAAQVRVSPGPLSPGGGEEIMAEAGVFSCSSRSGRGWPEAT